MKCHSNSPLGKPFLPFFLPSFLPRHDPLVVVGRFPRSGGPGSPGKRGGQGRRGVLQAAAELLRHVSLPKEPRLHQLPARAAASRPPDRGHGTK